MSAVAPSLNQDSSYGEAALASECQQIAQTPAGQGRRNQTLNAGAFKIGRLVGSGMLSEPRATSALLEAARANGYVTKRGGTFALAVVKAGLAAGKKVPRSASTSNRFERRRAARVAVSVGSSFTPSPQIIDIATARHAATAPTDFPAWTPPDDNGKPKFIATDAEEPPKYSNELRRHLYRRGGPAGVVVHAKVKLSGEHAWLAWYRVRDDRGALGWQQKKPEGYSVVPYIASIDPFDREMAGDVLWWPEGEKDADSLSSLGLLAFTFGGVGGGVPSGAADYVCGRDVVILADNDDQGRKHANDKAAAAHSVTKSVRVIWFPELPAKGDVSDWLQTGKTVDDLWAYADAAPLWSPPAEPTAPTIQNRGLIICSAADIEPEKVEWLWPGRAAVGKITLIGGTPGLGKSQIHAFMCAVVSTGGPWPCGEGRAPLGNSLVMSAEDGLRDTIVPRLIAAEADRSRIHIISGVLDERGRRTFNLKADIAELERHVAIIGDVRLIVVDPISAYMAGADGNGNTETREILEPIAEMADRLRVAVVCITHLNKGSSGGKQSALNRFVGSIAFTAAARAAFAVIEDADDESRRMFLQVKNNLGKPCRGLTFRIEQMLITGDILASRVSWDSEPVDVDVNAALAASEAGPDTGGRTNKDDATEFLRELLAGGAMSVKEIEAQAVAAGLLAESKPIGQNKAFREARSVLGIVPRRTGGLASGGQWTWALPPAGSANAKVPNDLRCPQGHLGTLAAS